MISPGRVVCRTSPLILLVACLSAVLALPSWTLSRPSAPIDPDPRPSGALASPPAGAHQTRAAAREGYDFTGVEATIRQALAKREIPSMVVAISKDGKILYEGAFGDADIEGKVPATVDTAYRLASVSKPITAAGLMVLHQRGLVKLDEPAEQYAKPLVFRSFAGDPSDVTLRHLLSHTSGLSSYFQYALGDEREGAPDFEAAFQRYGVFFHPAGSLTDYANLGYGLISFIISKQSGTPFADFMQANVFEPLGMKNSFVDKTANSSIRVAEAYGGDLKRLPDLYYNMAGAGNVYSSVRDLMLFSDLHLRPDEVRKPVLTRENAELMRAKAGNAFNPFFSPSTYYALGWYVQPDDGGYATMWHEGGMPGASSFLKLMPSEKIAVATITNVADKGELIEKVAHELIKVVLPSYRGEPPSATASYVPYEAQPDYLGKWVGAIHVQGRELPCTLTFGPAGELRISYAGSDDGSGPKEAAFRGMVNGKSFVGGFMGDLPSDDIRREPAPILVLHLIREGNVLSGRIAAYQASTPKFQHLYPFYIRLERENREQ